MTSLKQHLHHKLTEEFCPIHLSVIDDSHKHAGHAGAPDGGDSHFTVIIAAKAFDGLGRVDRQRAVTNILQPEFTNTNLHALSLKVYTPEEWVQKTKLS